MKLSSATCRATAAVRSQEDAVRQRGRGHPPTVGTPRADRQVAARRPGDPRPRCPHLRGWGQPHGAGGPSPLLPRPVIENDDSMEVLVGVVRVLVVDDQEPFRNAMAAVVEVTDGFEVVGAVASGEESLVAAEDLRPDLVLMDVNLPGVDGLEATRLIRARADAPIVLLLSTYDEDEFDHRQLGRRGLRAEGVVRPGPAGPGVGRGGGRTLTGRLGGLTVRVVGDRQPNQQPYVAGPGRVVGQLEACHPVPRPGPRRPRGPWRRPTPG